MSKMTVHPSAMSFDTETKGLLIPATWKTQLAQVPSGVRKRTFCSPLFGIFAPFAEMKFTPRSYPKDAVTTSHASHPKGMT